MNIKSPKNVSSDNVSKILFKNTLEITYSKRSKKVSVIALIVIFLFLIIYTRFKGFNELVSQNSLVNVILLAIITAFPFLISLILCFKFKLKNLKANATAVFGFYILSPLYMLIVSECLNRVFVASIRPIIFIGGYLLIAVLYLLLYAIIGSFKISAIFVNTLIFLLSLTNYYVFKFRGTPFLITDFFAAKTGANVASSYDFSPDFQMLAAILMFVFITVAYIKTDFPKLGITAKIILRTVSAVISVFAAILFFLTDIFLNFGIVPSFFQQSVSCSEQGFLLNFVSNIRYAYITSPEDYNNEEIKKYITDTYYSIDEYEAHTTPNIICIMNEALTDLSIFGEFETNEAYMPFLNSLTEDTVKGNLYVSVTGGGTANTEFEFLTGHTMAFLPSGSFPYVSYIEDPISSMVSTLKAQKYAVNAFHPYYASGWNRTEAYGYLGFEKFISLDNMFSKKMLEFIRLNEFNSKDLQNYTEKNYPYNADTFKRSYISDSYNFKQIIKDFENRDKSKPYFMFNVTMQNHGGYTIGADNLEEKIVATSLSKNYEDVNRYLSLIKYTDSSFKELIEYFSNIEEPTVICMFGDHQPSLNPDFFAELINSNCGSYTDFQKFQNYFCTPFYIWANYDIEEMCIDKLSANYLSSYVMQIAGVELTTYNKYLLELSKSIPVINIAGYCDNKANYYTWEDYSPYTNLLNDYKKIQYNNLFDHKNVDYDVFYIEDYVPAMVDLAN